jgi:pimeloyl-ACP methyl ester carboxylesterase
MEMKTKALRILFRLVRLGLLALVIFYVGMCALVFVFQRQLLYLPPVRSTKLVNQMAREAGMERWTNSAGQSVGMKRLATNSPAIGTVLMCYGNASSAVRCSVYADVIQSVAPLDFYVLEYPGYEDRAGQPGQESILSAAEEALQLLDTNRPIYLVGESLGTGVASFLAGKFPEKISGITLFSPYHELAAVAQSHYPLLPARWLLLDDFQSEVYLKNFRGRVGIVIDGLDEVVPAKFGRRLFDGYAGPKRLWEYPKSNHVELGEPPEKFWQAAIGFWRGGETLN